VYNVDELEQYGRRENLRIHGVSKSKGNGDDGEEVVKLAGELGISLDNWNIQRAHRLGKKKRSPTAKPRQIIVRLLSYKKRNEFLHSKSALKDTDTFPRAIISTRPYSLTIETVNLRQK